MARAKVKTGLTLFMLFVTIALLSRPTFYSVLAKVIVVSVRAIVRRTVGLVVLLLDALLDEAAASLEASLITPPTPTHLPEHLNAAHAPAPRSMYELLWHGLFTVLGVLIGQRLPRANRPDRNAQPPTRLRVV